MTINNTAADFNSAISRLTAKELIVFKAIITESRGNGYDFTFSDELELEGMSARSRGGVLASLSRKGIIASYEEGIDGAVQITGANESAESEDSGHFSLHAIDWANGTAHEMADDDHDTSEYETAIQRRAAMKALERVLKDSGVAFDSLKTEVQGKMVSSMINVMLETASEDSMWREAALDAFGE